MDTEFELQPAIQMFYHQNLALFLLTCSAHSAHLHDYEFTLDSIDE